MKRVVMIVLLFVANSAFAGAYKCIDGGNVTYADRPCESIGLRNAKGSQINPSPKPMSSAEKALARSVNIDFGTNPAASLVTIKAVLDSLDVDGRDCEWALKVDESKLYKCTEFLPKMMENAEWGQVMNAVQNLLRDESFYSQHRIEFSAIQRKVERISGYSQFAKFRLIKK